MKKNFIIILCFFLIFVQENIKAQSSVNLRDTLDRMFAPLNTSKLKTHLLIDKTIITSKIKKFNGVYDTVGSWDAFTNVYSNIGVHRTIIYYDLFMRRDFSRQFDPANPWGASAQDPLSAIFDGSLNYLIQKLDKRYFYKR